MIAIGSHCLQPINKDTRKERVSERDKKVVQTFLSLNQNSLIGLLSKLQFEYTQYRALLQRYFSKYLLRAGGIDDREDLSSP